MRPDSAWAFDRSALFRLATVSPAEPKQFFAPGRLNRKDIGQIAVVIFCPNVLVVVRVDQLHVHSDAIASPTDAAFQKRGYSQRFAYFTGVAHSIAPIRHDRHARDDLQIADL